MYLPRSREVVAKLRIPDKSPVTNCKRGGQHDVMMSSLCVERVIVLRVGEWRIGGRTLAATPHECGNDRKRQEAWTVAPLAAVRKQF